MFRPLPLHLGDRLLLRDPSTRRVAGATVAELTPRPVRRRGDAAMLGAALTVPTTADELVVRRGVCRDDELVAAGLTPPPTSALRVGEQWVSAQAWRDLAEQVRARLDARDHKAGDGVPVATLAHDLEVPAAVISAIAAEGNALVVVDARIRRLTDIPQVGPQVQTLLARLEKSPFHAPDRDELATLGLGDRELAVACREQLLLRLAAGIYLRADAPDRAVELLEQLAQPFTVSAARTALGSTRRVVVPLLEHLDASRRTRRLPDGTRVVVARPA
jgi:selenocysteine-specific elongation factor